MRYISEYPETDLKDCVKFSFTFGSPDIESNTYSFNSEFTSGKFRTRLSLKNKLPILKEKSSDSRPIVMPVSLIDIDVIIDKLSLTDPKALLNYIDKTHLMQKEVFFNLLKQDFLKTLNPEY